MRPAGVGSHSGSGDDGGVGGGVGCLGIGTTAATGRPGRTSDEVGRLIRNRGCTSSSEPWANRTYGLSIPIVPLIWHVLEKPVKVTCPTQTGGGKQGFTPSNLSRLQCALFERLNWPCAAVVHALVLCQKLECASSLVNATARFSAGA